ncbi:TPA: hypothetical protein ACNSIY_000579 [Staphylococcus aureus]|nr:hypothetical protein DQV82_12475 [Staphylococcus aureus]HDJ4147189.1 hypothetical protein [Staphylococcus aureus]
MRKIWVIDRLYASTFFVDCLTVNSHLYTLTNFENLNHYLIILLIAHAQHKKETCQ